MKRYYNSAAILAAAFYFGETGVAYSATIGGDRATLSTQDQNMFGDSPGAVGFTPDDLIIVDTGILDDKVVGEIKNVNNTAGKAAFATLNTAYNAAVATRNTAISGCNLIPLAGPRNICLGAIPGLPPRPVAPPDTVKDGTAVTISNVGVRFGFGGEFELGAGSVSASQEFQSSFTVDKTEFEKGDELVIGTGVELGTASLSSEVGGLNGSIETVLDISGKVALEQYILGLRTPGTPVDVINIDEEELRNTIVGFELDDQSAQVEALGLKLEGDIPKGIPKTFNVPGTVFPAGDITLFAPDIDVEGATALGSIGAPFGLLPVVETSVGGTQDRTGNGVLPQDFAKLDLDVDVVTVAAGAPLGARVDLAGVVDIEVNALDLDAGGFFSLSQDQSFYTEEILVTMRFGTPTEVETFVGSGVFELVSEKTVVLGTEIKIKHPGDNLDITPEYTVGRNVYSNRTGITLSPAITLALFQIKIGGAFGLLLPSELKEFSVFEDTFEPTDTFDLGNLFDDEFALLDFSTSVGSMFSLNAARVVASVPVPAGLPMLLAGLGLLALQRRRQLR